MTEPDNIAEVLAQIFTDKDRAKLAEWEGSGTECFEDHEWIAASARADCAAKVAAALQQQAQTVPVESLGRDAEPVAGCIHHDFSILDSYIRDLRWSHDTPNEIRDAVASNLRGLYTHLLARGLFAGSGSWDAGRMAAAKWVEKRRCAFADEYGLVDPTTGVLEFGNGYPERDEHYCELSGIEEAIRALPAPQFVAHPKPTAPPAPVVSDDAADAALFRYIEKHVAAWHADGAELPRFVLDPRFESKGGSECSLIVTGRDGVGTVSLRTALRIIQENTTPPTNQEGAAP